MAFTTCSRGRGTRAAIAAIAIAAIPLSAPAAPSVVASYAANAYVLAAACASSQPIAYVNLAVENRGAKKSVTFAASATDAAGVLTGAADVPAIDPGASVALQIPLRYVSSSGVPVAGNHLVTVVAGKKKLEPLVVSVPADFCTPGSAPASAPVTSKVPPMKSDSVRAVRVIPSGALTEQTSQRGSAISAALKIASPTGVHAVIGGPECAAHVGALGALVCPDMIKSGDLLLGWEWQPGAGPAQIDGYRVYRVDGGAHELVYTQANKRDVTLVDVPKSSGVSGRCYAVAAYAGARESAPSGAFCAGAASSAKTVVLQPLHRRSSHASGGAKGNPISGSFSEAIADDPMVVGFAYSAEEHTFGDSHYYQYHRAGVVFDVSSLRNRRIVSARLRVTINSSEGAGNNHSCTTGVGSGTEFWWKNSAWLAGSFPSDSPTSVADQGAGITPTDTGPEITADVTPIVAGWLRGEPNYGFIMKNADENPNAFTNKRCLTTYVKPLLDVTYY